MKTRMSARYAGLGWITGLACLLACLVFASTASARDVSAHNRLPHDRTAGDIEQVFTFTQQMPTGVTVSQDKRIFVNFPRWNKPIAFTVGEIKNDRVVPYPGADINKFDKAHAAQTFVSVQSVVVGPDNRLWVLDTGRVHFNPVIPGGPKLVAIDLDSNRVVKTIHFPSDVVLPTSYLNDVRFDLRRGKAGAAYITDSSTTGPNAIIVVDLATGKSWRRLNNVPSTQAVPNFLPFVEGRPLMKDPAGKPPSYVKWGADGIAIGPQGKRLYYCPLASRHLYSVSTEALWNRNIPESKVKATVRDLGFKTASDGLAADTQGRIYATAYNHNGIVRRQTNGRYETLVHDPRVLWPDTLSLAGDGYLYFTANQLHRQPSFNNGKDLRQKPYSLFRIKVDAQPVRLR